MTWTCTLVISLVAPALTLYWIIYESETLVGVDCDLITSALGPALVAFAAAFYMAEVFSGVFRGCINSCIICTVADVELFNDNERFTNNEYMYYLNKKKVHPEDEGNGESFKAGQFKSPDIDGKETELITTERGSAT